MDPTHYKTASGKDCTIKVKPTGINFGCKSIIRIGGRTVWDSETYPTGCAQKAEESAVKALEKF